jgi:Ca2+-binding EF-hand superfamily protein
MRKTSAIVVVTFLAAATAGCALNPFAEDNIYKRKRAEPASERNMEMAKADFQKVDADRNGVISKQEGERVSGLSAIFDKHDPDRDGTLDMQEFNAAMNAINAGRR